MTRRELLGLAAAAPFAARKSLFAKDAPAAPVSVAKLASYANNDEITSTISTMFDQIGGLSGLVKNKTVTVKMNLTGSPATRLQGRPLGSTHYTHPKTVMSMVHLLDQAGARRIRLVEGCFSTNAPLEEFLLDSGWNVRSLQSLSKNLEFENTNIAGKHKGYGRFKVASGAMIFPAYDLNKAYAETDVLVSMAKLKDHATCGVTLSMKNMFGCTPISIYGDDAGRDEPNEDPKSGRGTVCHEGKREPSKSAPQEIDPKSSRHPGYRMPRIVAELAVALPVQIAFIDGVEVMAGGEGPWISKVRPIKPGVMAVGTNAVCTDAVATALMGYDPKAPRGKAPFEDCDNSLWLAEQLGAGTCDLNRIEVVGTPIKDAIFKYRV
jgi:uncharacterized protein (DUF362 family)